MNIFSLKLKYRSFQRAKVRESMVWETELSYLLIGKEKPCLTDCDYLGLTVDTFFT